MIVLAFLQTKEVQALQRNHSTLDKQNNALSLSIDQLLFKNSILSTTRFKLSFLVDANTYKGRKKLTYVFIFMPALVKRLHIYLHSHCVDERVSIDMLLMWIAISRILEGKAGVQNALGKFLDDTLIVRAIAERKFNGYLSPSFRFCLILSKRQEKCKSSYSLILINQKIMKHYLYKRYHMAFYASLSNNNEGCSSYDMIQKATGNKRFN